MKRKASDLDDLSEDVKSAVKARQRLDNTVGPLDPGAYDAFVIFIQEEALNGRTKTFFVGNEFLSRVWARSAYIRHEFEKRGFKTDLNGVHWSAPGPTEINDMTAQNCKDTAVRAQIRNVVAKAANTIRVYTEQNGHKIPLGTLEPETVEFLTQNGVKLEKIGIKEYCL